MHIKLIRTLALPGFLLLLGLGGPVREKTEQGNRLYEQAKYDQALTSYVEARSHAEPGRSGGDDAEATARLHFNIGDALYKQKKYEEARKEHEMSLLSNDPGLQEKSCYNIGNSYFQEALGKQDMELLEQAAASYRKALELDPDDEDAKYNLEVVRRHIDLQQQQQQPQPPCPNGQDQKDQDEEQQKQGQDQQKREQQEQEQARQQPEEGREQRREEQQAQPSAAEERKFTEGEAERILDALQEREKEELKESYKQRVQGRHGQGKDW